MSTPLPPADWSPSSWKSHPAQQQPRYADPSQVDRVVERLSKLPPLVTSWEVNELKRQMAEAARGERFLLQGGDCAERLEDCNADSITSKLKILLQVSLVLIHGTKKPVTRVGRFAGQYAKPRSDGTETRDGVALPSYRGDLVNSREFTAAAREPDPELMLRAYERSALTLNFLRALARGGFADLHHPEYWDLSFARHSPMESEYHQIVATIGESLRFMESVLGVQRSGPLTSVDFFTCHEALLLPYEQAQTREAPHNKAWYNLSTHFPWIGMRTAQPDGAHVECFRGIANPIGVKIGPGTPLDDIPRLIDALNPNNEEGRLTFIHRMGCGKVARALPDLIGRVQRDGGKVLWVSDPMHGNTQNATSGYKTRRFEDILSELEQAFDIHAAMGTILGGVHFEMTGDNVTECVGGARGLDEEGLAKAYRSGVDPRLNYEQALEMALLIARKMAALPLQWKKPPPHDLPRSD